jgi:enhancing lycopene biosynthesis protein 2
MSQKNVLVLLSGCGVFDGSEIHESVITLLALSKVGAKATVTAPDKDQAHVINHHAGAPAEETRNVLVESARIARGPVVPLSDVNASDYDAVFLPGGFGAAKNLNTFAFDGADCSIDSDVERVLKDFHAQGKPIGAVCIAPTVVVRALGLGIVTIGSDADTAAAIETMGGSHMICDVTEIAIDPANKIVTAPAYMCEASLADIAIGIERAVSATVELAG